VQLEALNSVERDLVQRSIEYLRFYNSPEAEMVENRFKAVEQLAEAIGKFPSVKDAQFLLGTIRDGTTLVSSLVGLSSSARLLHTPTRVVALRSLLVAKIHAFSLLSLLVRQEEALRSACRSAIFSMVCAFLVEDVYSSLLEDPLLGSDKKESLAYDLVRLWENGTDPRSSEHIPPLRALWIARDSTPPIFGTMDGSSELIRISLDLENDWQDFILNSLNDEETRGALEEFLFGLSFEEIHQVRSRLAKFGIGAVGQEEVRAYLGDRPAYSSIDGSDPRSMYDFYVQRRDFALTRGRVGLPGPKRSLEELYLIHRMS